MCLCVYLWIALLSNAAGSWCFIVVAAKNPATLDKGRERYTDTTIEPREDDAV